MKQVSSTFNELSAAQIRAIYAAMVEGVIVYDRTGRAAHFNPAALKILGLTEVQLLERSSFDPRWRLVDVNLNALAPEAFPSQIAMRTRRPTPNMIIGVYRTEGELRWLDINVNPMFLDGDLYQVLTTFRDVTEARATRLALERAEARALDERKFLDRILDAMPALVSYVDEKLVYRYVNETYCEWWGRPREAIVNRNIADFLGDEGMKSIAPYLERVFRGEQQRFSRTMTHANGDSRDVDITYLPDVGHDGRVRGLFAIVQDVTLPMRAMRQVREQKALSQKMIDGVPALIGYYDRDLKNVFANRAYAAYFDQDPAQLRGRSIQDILGAEGFAQSVDSIQGALRGEAQTFERQIDDARNGRYETLVRYLPDMDGPSVLGFFVVITDITTLRDLERARQTMQGKLISSSKLSALGEMAGGIAHEINNPLAIISALATRLKTACQSDAIDAAEFILRLDRIEATVQRAARIIRGLRTFAGGTDSELPQRQDIRKIVDETLDLCYERFGLHGVRIALSNYDKPHVVVCQPGQISQILLNLLNNAFDAIEPLAEKWIDIDLSTNGSRLIVRVTDSGSGIPPEVAAKVMNPFFTTKPIGKGTGLGLSISRGLAERNGGSLTLVPESSRTCFELALPLAPAAVD